MVVSCPAPISSDGASAKRFRNLLLAETAIVFDGAGQPEPDMRRLIEPTDIQLAPIAVERTRREDEGGDVAIRLLGHAIDEAARRSSAIQHSRRSFDDLDPIDVRQVAIVKGVVPEAVHELIGDRRETAYPELVPLSVARCEGDARHIPDGILKRQRALSRSTSAGTTAMDWGISRHLRGGAVLQHITVPQPCNDNVSALLVLAELVGLSSRAERQCHERARNAQTLPKLHMTPHLPYLS